MDAKRVSEELERRIREKPFVPFTIVGLDGTRYKFTREKRYVLNWRPGSVTLENPQTHRVQHLPLTEVAGIEPGPIS